MRYTVSRLLNETLLLNVTCSQMLHSKKKKKKQAYIILHSPNVNALKPVFLLASSLFSNHILIILTNNDHFCIKMTLYAC